MTFPTTAISTLNLDSGTDDPSLARVDLLQCVQHVNTIVSEANTANGVLVLGGTAQVASSQLPSTISPAATLVLSPTTGVVKIEDVLRLQQLTTDQVLLLTDSESGDVVFVTDGDAGDACLAVYANSEWNVLKFNQGTIAKDTQAAFAVAVTLTAVPTP